MTRAGILFYKNAKQKKDKPDTLICVPSDGYPEEILPKLVEVLQDNLDFLDFETQHCLVGQIEEALDIEQTFEDDWYYSCDYLYRVDREEKTLSVIEAKTDWRTLKTRRKVVASINLTAEFNGDNPHLDKIGRYWIGSGETFSTMKEVREESRKRRAYYRGAIPSFKKLNDNLEVEVFYA